MFDWDDQELANIIWDEDSEANDHIVPYPEVTKKKDLSGYRDNYKKKLLNEEDTNNKASEQNTYTPEPITDGAKRESGTDLSASGVVIDLQLDLPSFATLKTDDITVDKKTQIDTRPEISEDDKELGELVGDSWATIGSFDDLDRIFSNDDLDGQISLGSADELWSSSKDLVSGAAKSSPDSTSWELGALGSTCGDFESNSKYKDNGNRFVTPLCQKSDASYSQRNADGCMHQEGYALRTTTLVKEKVRKRGLGNTKKTPLDSLLSSENVATPNKLADKKTDKIADSRLLRDTYGIRPLSAANDPQFDDQCRQNYPAPDPSHQMVYEHFLNPYFSSCAYGNFTHEYPTTRSLEPTDDRHQPILSSPEACPDNIIPLNKPRKTPTKPVNMTPQEKIEKLRRRQKIRAMLAIQKQQQRLGNQASSVDYCPSQKSSKEDQVMHMEKTDAENDESLKVPLDKRNDSNTISDIDNCSGDTILYQLQDVITRLDKEVRLSIRDSLYRLSHSAIQRIYASGASNTNRSIKKEEISSHDRFTGEANVEVETNHIDRVVAHLLFHRPFKSSVKHGQTPESSSKMRMEDVES